MALKIPPPIQALLMALLMWLISKNSVFLAFDYSMIMPLVYGFVLLGIIVDGLAIVSFRKAKTTVNPLKPDTASFLVNEGVYRYTRNPMYVGMVLFLVAWCLYLGSLLNVLVIVFFVIYMTYFQIIPEERALEKIFGQAYADYKTKVRRWV